LDSRLEGREVIQSPTDRQVYAEGILKACRLYVEPPLLCVTGGTLRQRSVRFRRNSFGPSKTVSMERSPLSWTGRPEYRGTVDRSLDSGSLS
jgi:hypothetical protein